MDTVHLFRLGAGRDMAWIYLRSLLRDSILQVKTTFVHPPVWDVLRVVEPSKASDSYVNVRTKDLLKRVRTLCSRLR